MTAIELTRFMNKATYSAEEMSSYPYDKRREYVFLTGHFEEEPIKFFATSDNTARQYVKENYILEKCPEPSLARICRSVREVSL